MKKENKLFYAAILIMIVIISLSCQKEKYPYQALNIKATDCTFSVDKDVVNFTYIANTSTGESYKREILTGYCNVRNVKEYNSAYLWIDTAMIVSGGIGYME